ncbi:hypothetical protein B296_00007968 [Ensete ventricosum]|uniref:Uncharacterized protein n=1 Tax=Ensete ventricosum TaxID=4639 RepID=A0A426X142_ENSVE|nr:hypothetical protein B296_00007968 [Ensete ventricosum]
MTSPHARPATHDQAAAKAPYKGAVAARKGGACGHKRRPRGQQSLAGTADCSQPIGAAAAYNAAPAKGADYWAPARGCRPRPALPPAGVATPTVVVVAPWQGGCQRARAATTMTATQRGKEGLGHPMEKRMILPI